MRKVYVRYLICVCFCCLSLVGHAAQSVDLRIGVFSFEPFNFIDAKGEAQGLYPDLIREIARQEGWHPKFIEGSWAQGLDRLKKGEIDLMVSVAYSDQRAESMDFSHESVAELWGQVFIRPGGKIHNITDLDGLSVGVMSKDISASNFSETADKFGVKCNIVEFASHAEVFEAVQQKKVAAGVAPQHFGLRHAAAFDLIPSSIQFSPFSIYFAVTKGRHFQILATLDRYLILWKQDPNSYYYQRLSHWLGTTSHGKPLIPSWILPTLAGSSAATLIFLIGFIVARKQVTKRTRLLLAAEQRFRKALLEAPFPIMLHASDGQVLLINKAWTELTGYAEEEIPTLKEWTKRAYGDEAEKVQAYIQTIYDQESPVPEGEYRILCAGGRQRVWAFSSSSLGRLEDGRKIAISMAMDVTDRKKAEAERAKIEEKMLHAQKLESLGVLAGGIAHDFNNLLMAIIGNTELAKRRLAPESPAQGCLTQIDAATRKAADLANQMLAYSGRGKFVIETMDLNRLITEMLHLLEVSISKKAVMRTELGTALPGIDADATQIRQIIMNLVINASDAIGDRSGVIALSTGVADCDRSYLRDVWMDENLPEGLYVYFEVADTGCGMTKETVDRIFDPFYSTKFSGRGLGLAAVLGIVRGHKGAIKVYTEEKRGTTFKVLLPASNKPVEWLGHDSGSETFEGSGSVLLVDDEETVRATGKALLQELGFEVLTASDGREALDVFKKEYQHLKFVLMDLTMPHMDGEQAFREMRRIDHSVKVIISSGYNEQEVTQKFVGKGLAGFIKKPFSLTELKVSVSKAMS